MTNCSCVFSVLQSAWSNPCGYLVAKLHAYKITDYDLHCAKPGQEMESEVCYGICDGLHLLRRNSLELNLHYAKMHITANRYKYHVQNLAGDKCIHPAGSGRTQ